MIKIINRQRKIVVDCKYLEFVIQTMLTELLYSDFDIAILLTTNASIRKFNREFRDKDKATDILSFPFYPFLKPGKRIKAISPDEKNLGDIVISLAYVQKKAPEWNRSFSEHLVALLAHGIAHLLNYDHQTDEEFKVMNKIEKRLIQAVNNATYKKNKVLESC